MLETRRLIISVKFEYQWEKRQNLVRKNTDGRRFGKNNFQYNSVVAVAVGLINFKAQPVYIDKLYL